MFRRPPSRNLENTRYYSIMAVSNTASLEELKKAYHRAAIRYHPNKGDDSEKFKKVAQAYEVLSNPEKRCIYDQFGEDALKEGRVPVNLPSIHLAYLSPYLAMQAVVFHLEVVLLVV
ncbi:hypothetical protein L7F22_061136 [Adiantum nelumboides]|nr:hypothetical protein [Adiantum nelumboides]